MLKFWNWYETRNHLWIIFEYCPGGDLFTLLETDKKLPPAQIRSFTYELLEGLSYLHSQGVIYCDLKPSNVLLNEYGTLKLSDFGLSKKINDYINNNGGNSDSLSNSSDPSKPKAGTPYYMAPELFSDNGVHSFFSDFWALGCVMYEMATGKPPFSSNSLKDLIKNICENEYVPLEGFSDEFNDLVKRLLEKDPIKRINWEEIKAH